MYRTNKFKDCWYDGRFRLDYIPNNLIMENIRISGRIIDTRHKGEDCEDCEDCEHRFFHFSAVKKHNARIMISPLCLFV